MHKGQPFMDVEADSAPKDWERGKKNPRVFSEAFLYPTVGKGDARFILGVAEEYDHIIQALGPKALRLILDVKPRLSQRLGLPQAVIECLQDAASTDFELREHRMPSQVILDEASAHDIWTLLHGEYRRHFDPEQSMSADILRAYNTLTDALGNWEQEEREKERARLPEKLEKQAERKRQVEERRAARLSKRQRIQAVIERLAADQPIDGREAADALAGAIERELREQGQ